MLSPKQPLIRAPDQRFRFPHPRILIALGVILTVVLVSVRLFAQTIPMNREDAVLRGRALAEAKQYDEALQIFREMVARDPQDFEARNWVARLESWKGNFARAEQLYRAVLSDAPANLEAELGLADVMAWQKRYAEAIARLLDLLALHPQNTELLVRLGRFHRWQGKRRQALQYYREVLTLEPSHREASSTVNTLDAERPFRIEMGYLLEEFSFASNTNGQFVELLYRDYDRLTALGRFHYQNKFEENDTRFTAGLTYRLLDRTWLRGEVSLAPHRNRVIANQEYTMELTQGLRGRLAVGGGYRFLNFQTANVHIPFALVNWDILTNLHLYVRYLPARTNFASPLASLWNHGGFARMVWDANRKLSPYWVLGIGAENFTGVAADRLGRFAAQSIGAGTEIRVKDFQGLRVGYYYQNRTEGRHEQGFSVSYFLDFWP